MMPYTAILFLGIHPSKEKVIELLSCELKRNPLFKEKATGGIISRSFDLKPETCVAKSNGRRPIGSFSAKQSIPYNSFFLSFQLGRTRLAEYN